MHCYFLHFIINSYSQHNMYLRFIYFVIALLNNKRWITYKVFIGKIAITYCSLAANTIFLSMYIFTIIDLEFSEAMITLKNDCEFVFMRHGWINPDHSLKHTNILLYQYFSFHDICITTLEQCFKRISAHCLFSLYLTHRER